MNVFSRTQKARLMRVFHVRRLVLATLVATVVGGGWEMVASLAALADVHIPHGFAVPLAIALPTLAHVLRMWAGGRGWSALTAQEVPHLASYLDGTVNLDHVPAQGTLALPLKVQADLGRLIHRQGWLAWSDIDAVLKAHDCPGRATFLGGGAGTDRIARRSDLDRVLFPAATLDVALPLQTARSVRQRL